MRNLRRLAWAVVLAATAAPAAAQQQGGNPVNIPTVQFPTAPTVDSSAGSSTNLGATSGGTGTPSEISLTQVEKAPTIMAPSMYKAAGNVIQGSNFLGATYANPYYSGTLEKARAGSNPGGFGALSFGTGTGTTGGARATTTGRAGGAFATDPGGQIVALPRQIAYTAQLKFTPPATPAPRLQADLRGLIDRAGLTVPAGSVQVQVDGTNTVVLRGAVRDGDEARMVEGLVRLTPGVSRITNELSYPR